MSLKKTSNRKIDNKENDVLKSWCHDFKEENDDSYESSGSLFENRSDPIYGNLIPLRESDIKINKGHVGDYSQVEIALNKTGEINAIDRPRMVFNVAKSMKQGSSEKDFLNFIERSFELDYITKSQQNEIIKILG